MPDPDLIIILQKKISDLTESLESLWYSFTQKTGPGSNDIQGSKMQSVNFKTGVSGWELSPDGNLEANSGTFRGALSANSLDIPDTTTANSFHVNTAGDTWWGATTFGAAIASISKAGAAIFTNVSISGYSLVVKGTFGGDGSDGALSITSGTTTISIASAISLLKNYTTISITGTGVLAFSNPHANGSIVLLKSTLGTTLTSSATPMIDCSGLGANGGAAGGSGVSAGGAGSNGNSFFNFQTIGGGGGTTAPAGGAGGAVPTAFSPASPFSTNGIPLLKYGINFWVGAGGGGGGTSNASNNATQGPGGKGGGGLIIECGGAWNFTTTSGISVAGLVG